MLDSNRVTRNAACVVLFTGLLASGCRREQPKVKITEVERCERGIDQAVLQTEVRESLRTYYRECANVYAEPACKQAYLSAAELEPDQQMPKVFQDCKTAYCPMFAGRGLEACQPGFEVTPANIVKTWPPLHDAILARDAKGYAPRLGRAMLVFYSRVIQRMGKLPGAPAAEPTPSPDAAATKEGGSDAAVAAPSTDAAVETPHDGGAHRASKVKASKAP